MVFGEMIRQSHSHKCTVICLIIDILTKVVRYLTLTASWRSLVFGKSGTFSGECHNLTTYKV